MQIEPFNIYSDNPESRLTDINIVGKTIKCCRLQGDSWPFFGNVPPDACFLKIETNLFICFEDGDVLELSGWDETLTASYNYYSGMPQFADGVPDPVIDSVINKNVRGKKIVDSSFCGEEFGFYSAFIELEDAMDIRLEATSQNTLDIALFKTINDSRFDKFYRGAFRQKRLLKLSRRHFGEE